MTSSIRVGDIADVLRGVTFKKAEGISDPQNGYLPVLRAGNISEWGLSYSDLVFVPAHRVKARQHLRSGDVLIASSSGSLDVVGKAGLVTGDFDGGFGAFCTVIRPFPSVDARYFGHFFRTASYRRRVRSLAAGANINNLRIGDLADIEIPLPPLSEQRRIADVLDRADELRAKRRAAISDLDSLTQAIFIDMFGDPVTNPKGLPKTSLGQVADFVGGGTPSRALSAFYTGDICWATSKDIKSPFLSDTQEHVTEEAIAASATKLVPPETILIVVKSKILARRLPVAVSRVPICFGQDLKGIIPRKGYNVSFIAESLRIGARVLLAKARGVNTEGLTLPHLRSFPILDVSGKSQREFTARASSVVDLAARHCAAGSRSEELFSSLQYRAFRGEL